MATRLIIETGSDRFTGELSIAERWKQLQLKEAQGKQIVHGERQLVSIFYFASFFAALLVSDFSIPSSHKLSAAAASRVSPFPSLQPGVYGEFCPGGTRARSVRARETTMMVDHGEIPMPEC